MDVLARHPSPPPHPFKLDLRDDRTNIKHKIAFDELQGLGAMDDALSQIHEAFQLASQLMKEIPASQNDPAYLAESCHGIVRAYVAAIRMLQPQGGDMITQPAPPFASDPDHHGAGDATIPFLGSLSTTQLGHLLDPTFHTLPEEFGGARAHETVRTSGTDVAGSSGGPVRQGAPSSRGSPPIQPRQGRRRYVRCRAFGVH
jgi:hypothetical protein